MKKIVLICIPVIMLVIGCSPKKHGPFIVSGKIEHAVSEKIFLMEVPFGAQQPILLDSATLSKHGTFELRAYGKEEGLYVVSIQNGPEVLIINDGNNIKLRLDVNSYKTYSVEGSDASKNLHTFLNTYDSTFSLLKDAFVMVDSLQKKDSSVELEVAKAEKTKQMTAVNSFIKQNIQTAKSPTLACYMTSIAFRTMELNDIKVLTDELNKKFKDNASIEKLVKLVDTQVNANPKLALMNKPAPDFSVKDTAGNTISLSSFKGKFVLVDFWASWCKPCREENPNVVAAYNQFKDKNFTILSVSLDSNKSAWKSAIDADGLVWNNGSDFMQWESPIAKKYKFEAIPFNVLIDPTGKIIATELTGDALQKKLSEVLK